jgi:hypothetical protein
MRLKMHTGILTDHSIRPTHNVIRIKKNKLKKTCVFHIQDVGKVYRYLIASYQNIFINSLIGTTIHKPN